jgi:hypothetical protein
MSLDLLDSLRHRFEIIPEVIHIGFPNRLRSTKVITLQKKNHQNSVGICQRKVSGKSSANALPPDKKKFLTVIIGGYTLRSSV